MTKAWQWSYTGTADQGISPVFYYICMSLFNWASSSPPTQAIHINLHSCSLYWDALEIEQRAYSFHT